MELTPLTVDGFRAVGEEGNETSVVEGAARRFLRASSIGFGGGAPSILLRRSAASVCNVAACRAATIAEVRAPSLAIHSISASGSTPLRQTLLSRFRILPAASVSGTPE